MTYYIENLHTDPYYNLALEQFVFDELDRKNNYFILWQNDNSIIVGKHQNTLEEINAAFIKEKNISVVRRLSGGGAVYHDLGNLNFTFINDAEKDKGLDFAFFCGLIQEALVSLGVPVEITGRNDMTVNGKKFSGNAQYIKQGRIMHHGTILYDSDLGVLSQALKPEDDKIESRSIKSVRGRVTNIRPCMKTDMTAEEFRTSLKNKMTALLNMEEFILEQKHLEAVEKIKEQVYSQWSWNYGSSPQYNTRKIRRVEKCGKIEIRMYIEKGGLIGDISFYGDFFGIRDPDELGKLLSGTRLERTELKAALSNIDIEQFFHSLDTETFLSLLLE